MSEETTEVVESPEQPEVVQEPVQEERGRSAFDTLFETVEAEEVEPEPVKEIGVPTDIETFLSAEAESEPEPEVESEPEVEEAEPEAEEVKEAEPKKKVKKIRKIEDPDVQVEEEPKVEPEVKEDPFIKELLPQELERYELAKFASERDERYAGLHDKYLDFFKKQKEYLDKRDADGDPIEDFQHDEEYQNFVNRNGVQLDHSEVRRIEKEMLKDEIRKEQSAELEELKKAQRNAEIKPQVERSKNEFNSQLGEVLPDQIMSVIKEKGIEEAAKQNPFEYQIADEEIRRAQAMSGALIEISSGLTQYSESDAAQSELIKFIEQEQTSYIETGDTHDEKGRPFMRRERFNSLPSDAERNKYWTWTNEDLLKLMKFRAGQSINARIDQHRQQMEAAGYIRQNSQPAPAPKATPEQQPPKAPAPRPSAGSAPSVPSTEERHPLHVLGL